MADQDSKITKPFAAPPQWAIELKTHIDERLDSQDAALDNVIHEGKLFGKRLGEFDERLTGVETRAGSHSIPIRESKQKDMVFEAQLAQERVAREELKADVAAMKAEVKADIAANTGITTEIKQEIASALKSPTVKSWATRLGALAVAAAAAGLVYLQATLNAKVAAIQAKPANTVLVPVPAPALERTMQDAGSQH